MLGRRLRRTAIPGAFFFSSFQSWGSRSGFCPVRGLRFRSALSGGPSAFSLPLDACWIPAQWFFTFPIPRRPWTLPRRWGRPVPIEEYVFYLTGFITVLLLYVWLSEYWLAAYTVLDYEGEARASRRLLQFHPTSVVLGVALVALAVLYKRWFSPVPAGWPGYFIVLVAGGLIPSASFYPVARRFINWRALSLTMFFVLLVSLLWEARLALPYGWWNYQHGAMMGVFIGAWSGLPVEAVLVWLAVTYGTVILFEVVKVWQASGHGRSRRSWDRLRDPFTPSPSKSTDAAGRDIASYVSTEWPLPNHRSY